MVYLCGNPVSIRIGVDLREFKSEKTNLSWWLFELQLVEIQAATEGVFRRRGYLRPSRSCDAQSFLKMMLAVQTLPAQLVRTPAYA